MANNLYNDDSIESLSPLEHVRLRPGMYAGDTTDATQLAIEILGNAIDEYNIGHGDTIKINFNGNKVLILDEGQGFPINVKRDDGETILQASFDVINTSGKFKDDGVYEGLSVGLNGIGSKLTNFLSHELQVISWNSKGEYEKVLFKEGVFKSRETGQEQHKSGTFVSFIPSEQFFTTPKVNETKLRDFCEDITCLCPGLTIVFNGEHIKHDEGIKDLLSRSLGNSIPLLNNSFIMFNQVGKQKIDLALTYCGKASSSIIAYVNCGLTTAGPHITGIKSCLTRTLNKWAKEQGLLKEKDKNLEGSALQEGLVLVCNITAEGVAYDAQVKSNITKIDTAFISSSLGEFFEIWLDNNPGDGQLIIEKALVARKAAEAAKKARAAVKAKAVSQEKKKAIQLPTTLTDCWSKDRSSCELIICEGKSAASGLVAARNSEFQAIYGVRGKMLSVLKTTPSNIYKNKEINNLVQALGLPVDERTCKLDYVPNKLRYGKIIAAADADPDGAAIENLLFNILWYMCPELITNGHVYSAIPPLYRVTDNKNQYTYLRDDAALENYKANGGTVKTINRVKGLGEQDSDELSYCLLDPNTRNIVQLEVIDYGRTDQTFKNLYGKTVEPRVRFLKEHSEEGRADYE